MNTLNIITDMYLDMLLVLIFGLTFFGSYLILGLLPEKLQGTVYQDSRKTMGWANIVLAAISAIFYFSNISNLDKSYSASMNLSCYYLVVIFVSKSFFTLLGHKTYYSAKRLKVAFTGYAVYLIIVWSSVLPFHAHYGKTIRIVAAVVLVLYICWQVWRFFVTYKRAVSIANNYYSYSIEVCIGWMIKCVYAIIALGLCSGTLAFASLAPRWFSVLFLFLTIAIFTYIFVSFQDFMIKFEQFAEPDESNKLNIIHTEVDTAAQSKITINAENQKVISRRLEQWINNKGFTNKDLTIQTVADQAATNRTYLSHYINSSFNYTFKEWITTLRIEEAKSILEKSRDIPISEVADTVGFSSLPAFSRSFTRYTSISPAKWRQEHHS